MVDDDGVMRLDKGDVEKEMEKRRREQKEKPITPLLSRDIHRFGGNKNCDMDNINELRNELLTDIPEIKSEIFKTFRKDIDLRNVFIAVLTHECSKYCELELENEDYGTFIGRHKQAYNKLGELKRLGLIRNLRIIRISEKEMKNGLLDDDEKKALEKWRKIIKSYTQKAYDYFYPKINYYTTTEKGRDTKLVRFIVNIRKEKNQDERSRW